MPKRNPTDKPVNTWFPEDKYRLLRRVQSTVFEKTGVTPNLEDLSLQAATNGLKQLCEENGVDYA